PGEGRQRATAVLDTLLIAMRAQRPLGEVQAVYRRFSDVLGSAGALEVPHGPLDLAAGRRLYLQNCASCHGRAWAGDGPAARGLATKPPAIGTDTMQDVSPALMYRMVS